MSKYTARQLRTAARITDATYDQWRARGFITRKSAGTGNPQLYSEDEIFRTALLAECVAMGLAVGTVSPLVTDRLILSFPGAYLVVRGDERYFYPWENKKDPEHSVLGYLAAHDGALCISLDKIEQRVKASLASGVPEAGVES